MNSPALSTWLRLYARASEWGRVTEVLVRYICARRIACMLVLANSWTPFLWAQWEDAEQLWESAHSSAPQGAWARLEIVEGDSIFVMALPVVKVSARRIFKDDTERRQYYLYTRAARRVYPYALHAVQLYEELQAETKGMSKGQRRRYFRREKRDLEKDYEEQLKNLTRTEGRVLIKMIEKELGKPFYELIKETRGGLSAAYWHNLGKLWGYDLKVPYTPGADPLLDEVLLDYDFGRPAWWWYP